MEVYRVMQPPHIMKLRVGLVRRISLGMRESIDSTDTHTPTQHTHKTHSQHTHTTYATHTYTHTYTHIRLSAYFVSLKYTVKRMQKTVRAIPAIANAYMTTVNHTSIPTIVLLGVPSVGTPSVMNIHQCNVVCRINRREVGNSPAHWSDEGTPLHRFC